MKQVGIEDVPHFAFNIKSDTTMEDIISDCFIVDANLESSVPNLTGRKYTTKAIWDTGATNSCISYRVVENLKLEPISTTPVITASDEVGVEAFVYLVDIGIPDLKVGHSKVAVLGMKMQDDALKYHASCLIIILTIFKCPPSAELFQCVSLYAAIHFQARTMLVAGYGQ